MVSSARSTSASDPAKLTVTCTNVTYAPSNWSASGRCPSVSTITGSVGVHFENTAARYSALASTSLPDAEIEWTPVRAASRFSSPASPSAVYSVAVSASPANRTKSCRRPDQIPAGCALAKSANYKAEFVRGYPVFADTVTCQLP